MKHKYSTWALAFLFVTGIILVYKTVDNFTFIFEYAGKIISALGPFISGFIIAYLLNLPIKRFRSLIEKSKSTFIKKHSKAISITTIYSLAIVLIIVILRLIIPALYENLMDLYYNIPFYYDLLVQRISDLQERFGIELIELNKQNAIDTMQSFLKSIRLAEFGKAAQGVINLTSGVISSFIAIIISIYMLVDKELLSKGIKRVFKALLPQKDILGFVELATRVNDIFSKYVFSVLLDGVIIGVLSTLVMLLLRVKYAPILGLMIGVFNLIPYFGAIIAGVVSVIVTLLTGGVMQAIWTAVALFVIQQIDGNFIGPKIMGNMLKSRPLLIILAVTVGGKLFGVWGMLLSVPIAMVIKMLFTELLIAKEEKKADKHD